ncbi:MAG TPA: hypothetical protein VJS44_10605 [Pyrinomonadaceae bacterium]|nr:hypothetical protein [Pyrinomonadaceae bacterium]
MLLIKLRSSGLLVVASLLLLLAADGIQAQSGRRAPKPVSPSVPAPTPQPEPAKTKAPTEPQISLLILSDISQNINFAIASPERITRWVGKRLRDASALSVNEGDSSSRKDAINRAKALKEGFVVFLQIDQMGYYTTTPGSARPSYDDMRINYYLYAPVTGKAQSSGVVYMKDSRGIIGGIGRGQGLPVCYPGISRDDYILIQASLEVASRIMNALNVTASAPCS